MGKEDWFRRTTWTQFDQEQFFARLSRTRTDGSKAQYLRIQADYLAGQGLFAEALALLDKLLAECPDSLSLGSARISRAECLAALGQHELVPEDLRAAIQAERDYPSVSDDAPLQFAIYAAANGRRELYEEAESYLSELLSADDLVLPWHEYVFNGVLAVFMEARGEHKRSRNHARAALEAAGLRHSGFSRHPRFGLVEPIPGLHERLVRLAES